MYVNNNKINFCMEYNFKKIDKYLIKINCKRKLIHTKNMFYKCSSLTSLNLSNFNTNNVTNIWYMFDGLNKDCKLICNDKKIINNFK